MEEKSLCMGQEERRRSEAVQWEIIFLYPVCQTLQGYPQACSSKGTPKTPLTSKVRSHLYCGLGHTSLSHPGLPDALLGTRNQLFA